MEETPFVRIIKIKQYFCVKETNKTITDMKKLILFSPTTLASSQRKTLSRPANSPSQTWASSR